MTNSSFFQLSITPLPLTRPPPPTKSQWCKTTIILLHPRTLWVGKLKRKEGVAWGLSWADWVAGWPTAEMTSPLMLWSLAGMAEGWDMMIQEQVWWLVLGGSTQGAPKEVPSWEGTFLETKAEAQVFWGSRRSQVVTFLPHSIGYKQVTYCRPDSRGMGLGIRPFLLVGVWQGHTQKSTEII